MFSQLPLPTDSEVSTSDITTLVLAEAIAHISQLTGLAKHACEALVKKQLIEKENINTTHNENVITQNENVITHSETDFISQLFKAN